MLGKLAWSILCGSDSFFTRVFRTKLLGDGVCTENMTLNSGTNLSWGARSVLHGLDFVRQHVGWKPGLESDLNVWMNRWVNGECPEPNGGILALEHVGLRNLMIRDLRIPSSNGSTATWNDSLIQTLFSEESAKRIPATPICNSRVQDKLYWLHNGVGEYGYGNNGTFISGLSCVTTLVSSEMGIRTENGSNLSIGKWFIDWISYLGTLEDADSRLICFLATFGCLWSVRNRILFQGMSFHPTMFFRLWSQVVETADKALSMVKNGKEVIVQGGIVGSVMKDDWFQWVRDSKPVCTVGTFNSYERMRIMVDAGWKSINKAGLGWVVFSATGDIIFSDKKRVRAESALQAEGIEKPHHQVVDILNDIHELVLSFHCLAFSFIPRSFNTVAHVLACEAMHG
ncbi:uncharacterized protein LOC141608306 [Silene latifolia]|uniref:uncharacterized protein LOC141608306 n=1 Tax=Silene latifolia TaxID=37657 RepID=UPI003D78676B